MYFEIDNFNALREALNRLSTGLLEQDVPQDAVYDSKLVASELVTNALRHGGGKAFFSVIIEENAISLSVRSVDSFRPPDKSILSGSESEHGRGLYIVDTIVETRRYSEEGGTSVVIRIRK